MSTELTFLQQFALWAQIGFYIVTGISVVATGALAAVKFRTFSRPFINVSLQASSRPCSTDHVQIGVTAKLHNGSQNLAKVAQLEWECRGIATYPPDAIKEKWKSTSKNPMVDLGRKTGTPSSLGTSNKG